MIKTSRKERREAARKVNAGVPAAEPIKGGNIAPKAEKPAKVAKSAKEKAVKIVMPSQNEITHPAPGGGVVSLLWATLDDIQSKFNRVPLMGEILAVGRDLKINEHTAKTQYSRWRKFHGLKAAGRAVKAEIKS